MKKRGILHAELARALAALGHKDTFLVGDAGMPVPKGVPCIDLAVTAGVPDFRSVVTAILDEVEVEGALLADEIREANPNQHAYLLEKLAGKSVAYVPHETLKERSRTARFAVRTGEFSPYPNVIFSAGVVF